MPRVAVISDLHVDIEHNEWREPPSIDADVLIVIGDVAAPMTVGIPWVVDHLCDSVQRCIWVPGNHCFYRGPSWSAEANTYYEDQMSRAREMAASMGVELLQNDVIEIAGVRYAGATLWSDFSILPAGWTRKMAMYYSQTGRLRGDERHGVRDRHSDYKEIRFGGGNSRHVFRPAQSLALHRESFDFFSRVLNTPHDGPTVCISHMAPAPSVAPGMHSWLYGCSDIVPLIEATKPECWLHGHVHTSHDYAIGETRVVCNPRGYPDRDAPSGRENADFDPNLVLEIGPEFNPTMRI